MWKELRGEAAGEGEEVKVDMGDGGMTVVRSAGGRCIPRRAVADPNPS